MWPPSPFSALPPVIYLEASPKAISRRTSYLRVRLEFLRYPQLIPAFFNRRLVRSSMRLYSHFNLAMDRSPGFGSTSCNSSPYSDSLSLRLRSSQILTSLHNVTRRSVLQKVQGRTLIVLPLLVNTGFQVLFHSPPGVLFTVPSQYSALSVTKEYLALGGGPPDFLQGSTCLAVLWIPLAGYRFRVRDFHSLRSDFPDSSTNDLPHLLWSITPGCTHPGLGSSNFARRYFRNRCFFLFLRLLRCFSSPGSLLIHYFIHVRMTGVFPAGFPHSDIPGS